MIKNLFSYKKFISKPKKTRVFGLIFLLLIFSVVPLFAQEPAKEPIQSYLAAPSERGEIWISAVAEAAFYSAFTFSYGPGLSIGYGKRVSTGLKAVFLFDAENELDVVEINFLLRWYLLSVTPTSGPFIQLAGGPAIFFEREKKISMPAEYGMLSAGLSAGWRFHIGNLFFIEPSIRGGYPYMAGVTLLSGVRF
ncbi:MAG: hypothetical protein FWE72_05570 [Spirochaetaceae bacterium]|nr:hypothetical protein [Spirochaetaceae bacterium]